MIVAGNIIERLTDVAAPTVGYKARGWYVGQITLTEGMDEFTPHCPLKHRYGSNVQTLVQPCREGREVRVSKANVQFVSCMPLNTRRLKQPSHVRGGVTCEL